VKIFRRWYLLARVLLRLIPLVLATRAIIKRLWLTIEEEFIIVRKNEGYTLLETMLVLLILMMVILSFNYAFLKALSLNQRLDTREKFYNLGSSLGQEILYNLSVGAIVPAFYHDLSSSLLMDYGYKFSDIVADDFSHKINIYFSYYPIAFIPGLVYQIELQFNNKSLLFYYYDLQP